MSQPLGRYALNDFVEAVVSCLRSAVGVEAVVAATSDATTRPPSIAVAIDFYGDVRGPVTWIFPRSIALELVRRLMDDPDPPPDTATEGATELANILTGHASAALEALGFRCEFGVPRIHIGAPPEGVIVRMTTPNGPIDIVSSLLASRTRGADHIAQIVTTCSRGWSILPRSV